MTLKPSHVPDNKTRGFGLRSVAWFLILCLWAGDPALYAAADLNPPDPLQVSVPPELGRIERRISGPSPKTVFFIQDAHDVLDAQTHIADLIHHLVETAGVRTVYEEGYEGPVPTEIIFGPEETPENRKKFSYFLLDQLRIGGAEYAHINRRKEFRLIGADSLRDQFENVRCYRDAVKIQKDLEEELKSAEKELLNLAVRLGMKSLKSFLRLREKYQHSEMDAMRYLAGLAALYPADPGEKPLEERFPLSALILRQQARSSPDDSASLERLNAADLASEMKALEAFLKLSFAREERGRKILQMLEKVDLLRRLNRLSLSADEYAEASAALDHFQAQEIADFLARETDRIAVIPRKWEEGLKSARDFYETALRREEKIRQSMRDFAQDPQERTAVLVYGGFHAAGIQEILKKQGLSFAVISPEVRQIEKRHQEYYRARMSGFDEDVPADSQSARMARPLSIYALLSGASEQPRSVFLNQLNSWRAAVTPRSPKTPLNKAEPGVLPAARLRSELRSEQENPGDRTAASGSAEPIKIQKDIVDLEKVKSAMVTGTGKLTDAQTATLFEALHAENVPAQLRNQIFDSLIQKNLNLIPHTAKRFGMSPVFPGHPAYPECVLALVTAVKKFDYTLGFKFSSFAVPKILGAMQKASSDEIGPLTLTRTYRRLRARARRVYQDLAHKLKREPTDQEWAAALGLTDLQMQTVIAVGGREAPLYTEARHRKRPAPVNRLLDDKMPEAPLEWWEAREELLRLLGFLKPREQLIMKLRYGIGTSDGEPLSLRKIGDLMGLTGARIEQLEKESLGILKMAQMDAELEPRSGEFAMFLSFLSAPARVLWKLGFGIGSPDAKSLRPQEIGQLFDLTMTTVNRLVREGEKALESYSARFTRKDLERGETKPPKKMRTYPVSRNHDDVRLLLQAWGLENDGEARSPERPVRSELRSRPDERFGAEAFEAFVRDSFDAALRRLDERFAGETDQQKEARQTVLLLEKKAAQTVLVTPALRFKNPRLHHVQTMLQLFERSLTQKISGQPFKFWITADGGRSSWTRIETEMEQRMRDWSFEFLRERGVNHYEAAGYGVLLKEIYEEMYRLNLTRETLANAVFSARQTLAGYVRAGAVRTWSPEDSRYVERLSGQILLVEPDVQFKHQVRLIVSGQGDGGPDSSWESAVLPQAIAAPLLRDLKAYANVMEHWPFRWIQTRLSLSHKRAALLSLASAAAAEFFGAGPAGAAAESLFLAGSTVLAAGHMMAKKRIRDRIRQFYGLLSDPSLFPEVHWAPYPQAVSAPVGGAPDARSELRVDSFGSEAARDTWIDRDLAQPLEIHTGVSVQWNEVDLKMSKKGILNAADETFLFRALHAVNLTEDQRKVLFDDLVLKNRGLIQTAKQMVWGSGVGQNPAVESGDVEQNGTLGLMIAVKKFDYTREVKFSTYAVDIIRAVIQKHHVGRNPLRYPWSVEEGLRSIKSAEARLKQAFGRRPTDEELLKEMSMKPERFRRLMALRNPLSLDWDDHGDQPSISAIVPDRVPESYDAASELDEHLAFLTPDEQLILKLFFGVGTISSEPLRLEDIGEIFKVSHARIGQIRERAVKKMLNRQNGGAAGGVVHPVSKDHADVWLAQVARLNPRSNEFLENRTAPLEELKRSFGDRVESGAYSPVRRGVAKARRGRKENPYTPPSNPPPPEASTRSELRGSPWRNAQEVYRDIDRLTGIERVSRSSRQDQRDAAQRELLMRLILRFDEAAQVIRAEMDERSVSTLRQTLGEIFDREADGLISMWVQQEDAGSLKAVLKWNGYPRTLDKAAARADKLHQGLDKIREPYRQAYRNASGRMRMAAKLMQLPPKTFEARLIRFGIDLSRVEVPPGALLQGLAREGENEADVRRRLHESLRAEKKGKTFNLVEFRRELQSHPSLDFLKSSGFSYARLLWGLNLAEDFFYEAQDRQNKNGNLMIRVGESFGFDRRSAKANMERILAELAELRKAFSTSRVLTPKSFDVLRAMGKNRPQVLQELDTVYAWNLSRFAADYPSIRWLVTRGYSRLVTALGIRDEAAAAVRRAYQINAGHLDYAAQSMGLIGPSYKKLAAFLQVNLAEITIPEEALLQALDAVNPQAKRAEILRWLEQDQWRNLHTLKRRVFENHAYFDEKVFSVSDVLWGLGLAQSFAERYQSLMQEPGSKSLNQIGQEFGWPKGSAKRVMESILRDSRFSPLLTRSELRKDSAVLLDLRHQKKPSAAMIDFRDLVTFTPREILEAAVVISQEQSVRFVIHDADKNHPDWLRLRGLLGDYDNVSWTSGAGPEAFRELGPRFKKHGVTAFARQGRDLSVYSETERRTIRFFAVVEDQPGTFAAALSYDPEQMIFRNNVRRDSRGFYIVNPVLAELGARYLADFAAAVSA